MCDNDQEGSPIYFNLFKIVKVMWDSHESRGCTMSTRLAQSKSGFNLEHRLSSYVDPGTFLELKAIGQVLLHKFFFLGITPIPYGSFKEVDFVHILKNTNITWNNTTYYIYV